MDDKLLYNDIEIEPIESLFNKIHNARGGEMVFIYVNKHSKDGPTVQVCSAIDKDNSIITQILPKLVEGLLDE